MTQVIEFRLLGPVEVLNGGRRVAMGGVRDLSLLAALLLEANRVVPVDRLVASAWGTDPPASARTVVRNRVSMIRRLLSPHDGAGLIETRGSGYVINLDDDQLDTRRFDRLVTSADGLAAAGEPGRAAEVFVEALGLWRGPALDGLQTPSLTAAAQQLEEARARAVERRVELELAAGKHREVLAELSALTQTYPLRERLREHLMLALYRAGRQSEALEVYRETRAMLADQLGVEPGRALQHLHQAILRGDEALSGRDAAVLPVGAVVAEVPRQIPLEGFGFTGRDREIAWLDDLLGSGCGVGVVAGSAGVGKTALAVHWAHRVAGEFPDGQLYLDLCGYTTRSPLRPAEALGMLLRSLGTRPDQVPLDVAEAAAMYRSLLAGRKVLVLLDNARTVEQVRSLLPGSPGCLVVITSRERLGGLLARDGARRITLDVLAPDEAGALLARLVGEERTRAEPQATAELADLCAYLPLALRIAAARLADRPHRRIAEYVAELRHGNRLTALAVDGDGEAAVRATLDLSYQTIPVEAQRMFRLLGLLPGADLTVDAAAALAGVAPPDAAALLNRLAGAHLIHEHVPDRYSFHDLLRQYAREQANAGGAAERAAALDRLLDWYLRMIVAARQSFQHLFHLPLPEPTGVPEFTDRAAALAWLDTELPNLVAAIEQASTHGPRAMTWRLADALRGYFGHRGQMDDWFTTCNTALEAAQADGHLGGQTAIHCSLAQAYFRLGRNPESMEHLSRALSLARQAGWAEAEAAVTGNLGIVLEEVGLLRQAAAVFVAALTLQCGLRQLPQEAKHLNNLANTYQRMGRLHAAARCATGALEIYRQIDGPPYHEAVALDTLGSIAHELGHPDRALDLISEALAVYRAAGDFQSETIAMIGLATVHTDRADYRSAMQYAEASLQLSADSDNLRTQGMALTALATVLDRLGRRADAAALFEQALATAAHAARHIQLTALIGLADTEPRTYRAIEYAQQALTIADHSDFQVLAGRALSTLAMLHRRLAPARATDYARWALAYGRQTGHRLDQARAHLALSACLTGNAAEIHRRAALQIYTTVGVPHVEHMRTLIRAW